MPKAPRSEALFEPGKKAPDVIIFPDEMVDELAPLLIFNDEEAKRFLKPRPKEPMSEALTAPGKILPESIIFPEAEIVDELAPEPTSTDEETKILRQAEPYAPKS